MRCCRILYAQASTIDWDDCNSIGYVVADHLGLELLDWQEVPWVCTGLCAVRGRRPPLSLPRRSCGWLSGGSSQCRRDVCV